MKFQIEQAVEILSNTPQTVKSLLGNLSDEWTESSGDSDDWTPFDVVGHYIHGEETDWIPRAEIILRQNAGETFEPFDRFAQATRFAGVPLGELLDLLERRRSESLDALRGFALTAADLERRGLHPELGPVTLAELLATWVVHDLGHIGQIARVMARQHAAEVGPWRAYLPVLTRA